MNEARTASGIAEYLQIAVQHITCMWKVIDAD